MLRGQAVDIEASVGPVPSPLIPLLCQLVLSRLASVNVKILALRVTQIR